MASKGIWHSKIEESEDYTISENAGRIVEFENLETEINVFVDEECLLEGTENPKTTLNDTKWILIEEVAWYKLLKKHQEEQKKNYIADLQEKIRTETDKDKKKSLENSLEILEDDTEKEDDNTLEFILQKERRK
ncbi:hypothetical protein [Chishuiella sp.]|uniref:hypothetical protein n=1 Tax=Chishuiella sp. TaxID=1969467 RepID=UPI0028A80B81|nr:hypothetical protein [Chishuiella sp.]